MNLMKNYMNYSRLYRQRLIVQIKISYMNRD